MNAHPSSLSDRELLELAAKAAGYEVEPHPNRNASRHLMFILNRNNWNPLVDDAHALRLAVRLGLVIYMPDADDKTVVARTSLLATAPRFMEEAKGSDPYAATRRAIVRAAAELAK